MSVGPETTKVYGGRLVPRRDRHGNRRPDRKATRLVGRSVTVEGYVYQHRHTELPAEIEAIVARKHLTDTDRLRLRAFAMSYIELRGNTGGAISADWHAEHLREFARVLEALGVKTKYIIKPTAPDELQPPLQPREARVAGFKAMMSWPFGGFHRTPGCGYAVCPPMTP